MPKATLSRRVPWVWVSCSLSLLLLLPAGCKSAKEREVQRLQARAAYEQGLTNLADNRLSLGLASLKEAVQLDPDNAVFHNALGVVLLDLRRPAEAQEEFQRAVNADSNYAEARHNLGLAMAEQGRFDEAIVQYRKALSLPIYPTPEIAYYNLGRTYSQLKKPKEAEEALRAAIQLSPKLVAAYYELGVVLTGQGRRDEARAAFRAARDLDPSSPFVPAAVQALKTLGEGG